MTTVFFLMLFHLSLGLLLTLPLVTDTAGTRYFKFCSASATFMTTAGLTLLYRRYGWSGPGLGGVHYPALVATTAGSLLFMVLYNRAWHFGWKSLRPWFLGGALGLGFTSVLLGTATPRGLVAVTDVTSIVLLGAAASAMILGHWYLVVLDLPISALRHLTVLLVVGLGLRSLVVVFALAGPVHIGLEDASRVAHGLWSPDGVFIWMRILFGIAGPLSLIWFIWKTVEIRSTQSATGILYVQLFLVMAGELLAKHLRVFAGLPL